MSIWTFLFGPNMLADPKNIYQGITPLLVNEMYFQVKVPAELTTFRQQAWVTAKKLQSSRIRFATEKKWASPLPSPLQLHPQNSFPSAVLNKTLASHWGKQLPCCTERLQVLAERVYPESQCGFRANSSTTDMVLCLRQLQLQGTTTATFCSLHRSYKGF